MDVFFNVILAGSRRIEWSSERGVRPAADLSSGLGFQAGKGRVGGWLGCKILFN